MEIAEALSAFGFWAIMTFLTWLFILQVLFRVIRHWRHFPVPAFMVQLIDNPVRRRFIQNPDVIADRVGLASWDESRGDRPWKG